MPDALLEDPVTASPHLIAEIGCNHAGDLDLAKRMISVAATFCEVDAIKFQKRDNRTLFTPEQYDAPHPNAMHAFGPTYGAHRDFLEFSMDQHAELKAHAESLGVTYGTSVWDLPSAKEVVDLEPVFIKIPSATNLNFELLDYLCTSYPGQIQLSLGMTSREEEDQIVALFRAHGRLGDLVLFACTSGYPVAFNDLALLEITRLRDSYGDEVAAIGFSGHHLGIAADIAAMALGASFVERHFTLDRTSKGTDHAASLEPDGLRKLGRDLRHVSMALKPKRSEILEVEAETRKKLKWLPGS